MKSSAKEQRETWHQYRYNLPRHLIGLSRHLQASTMHQLHNRGHTTLRMSFEPFISLLDKEGRRLTELADALSISKQACNQTVNQIEQAGYIKRIPTPSDGRAKTVILTSQGNQLRLDGISALNVLIADLEKLIEPTQLYELTQLLLTLCRALALPGLPNPNNHHVNAMMLGTLLPRISDYIMQRLMALTAARGHPDLKLSHNAVLMLIGIDGSRIQQIAKIQEVSKQAISAVAKDLEKLGYITRRADPEDSRQSVLTLSDLGLVLLNDSIASTHDLEKEFTQTLGEDKFKTLQLITATLFQALQLETEIYGNSHQQLQELADKLKQQLGIQGAAQLAKLLLKTNITAS